MYSWTVVRIPDGHELLLNDLGIVKFHGSWARPAPFTLGWSGDCHHWLVPLSPSRALAIAPDNTLGWFQALPAWVAIVNQRVARDAQRYVYSRRFESSVQEWWDRTKTA